MIRGLFRTDEEKQLLAELRASPQFRKCIEKLRIAESKAAANLLYASPRDLPTLQGYVRALNEILTELTKTGD